MEKAEIGSADLSAEEYLRKEIGPALFPILLLLEKLRPADPITFVAIQLLSYGK